MAQGTSQGGGYAQSGLSNIDYSQMLEQLLSLQNNTNIPESNRQALNEALAILNTQEIENTFQQIQSQSGQRSQTMSAATGQGASSTTTTGRGGAIGILGSGTRGDFDR